jgi:hypothetical protein
MDGQTVATPPHRAFKDSSSHKDLAAALLNMASQDVVRGDPAWRKRVWEWKDAPSTFWHSTHGDRVDFGITRLLL